MRYAAHFDIVCYELVAMRRLSVSIFSMSLLLMGVRKDRMVKRYVSAPSFEITGLAQVPEV